MFNAAIVIPVFQHGNVLEDTVLRLLPSEIPLIVVNDGSSPEQSQLIRKVCRNKQIKLLNRCSNGGKGAAVIDGLREARRQGYTHVIQVDADGQHDLSRLPEFIETARQHPDAMILGYPCYDESVPLGRQMGRWLTHIWVWINTLSLRIRDSMCGFKVYPVSSILAIIDGSYIGKHMDFDTELCVRACWKDLPIINLPVGVTYPDGGHSNFRIKQDNILITLMHVRLFFGMLLRLPFLLFARIRSMISGNLMQPKRADKQQKPANHWGMAFLINVMKFTGKKFVKLLVVPVALYYFLSSPKTRKVSSDYLSRLKKVGKYQGTPTGLSGKPLGWLAFKHILSFSTSMVDRVHAWSAGSKSTHYQVEGRELMLDVLYTKSRGALFLVTHLGNFDLAIARSDLVPGNRFNIVLDKNYSRAYNQFRDKIFKSAQVRFIEPNSLTPTKIISLANRAASGEFIIISADRIANPNTKNSVPVNFLGDQAVFPSGPYIMAHLLEIPVYCLFALKQHDSCLIKFEIFEKKIIIPRKQRQVAIQQYAQKFATRLERECFNFPLQWYNFYDFWARPEPTERNGYDDTY